MPPKSPFLSVEQSTRLSRVLSRSSHFALGFFVSAMLILGVTIAVTLQLMEFARQIWGSRPPVLIPAFLLSTVLLACGSWQLERACAFVRVENQEPFRWALLRAVLIGMGFVIAQMFALWCLLSQANHAHEFGLRTGAFAFVVMHGVHFFVALLFVVFVLLRALADRYDHEYSWGVVFCAWFWHALGFAWVVIAGAFVLAFSTVPDPATLPEW